jgi:hypothetical protein
MLFSKNPIKQEWLTEGLADITQGERPYMVVEYPTPNDSIKHNLIAEIMNNGWQRCRIL